MSYRSALSDAMAELAKDARTVFVGYGVTAGRAMGTIPGDAHCVETPVAENLMAGVALGLAMTGVVPVVYFERFDFVLNAADAIVNHIDKLEMMSLGAFRAGVILRVTVGNRRKPLFTGATHTQDFSEAFERMVQMPVLRLEGEGHIRTCYSFAYRSALLGKPTMLIELKDLI